MSRNKNREFSSEIKKILAEKAGYICSNPDCLANTIGGEDSFKCGEAAHINAVGNNWPRYDETLPDEYIRSEENGIWVCRICHKKIDNPKSNKYTVELLKEWKRKREHDAGIEVGRPRKDIQSTNLDENEIIVKKLDNIEKLIESNSESYNFKFDNYGISKNAFIQFSELNNALINRLLYKKDKVNYSSKVNFNMNEVFEWFIGNREFPLIEIKDLYKIYDNSLLEGDLSTIKTRRLAFLDYFNGSLEKCKNKYDDLYNKINSIKEKWIRDDILIDGRNLLIKYENLKQKQLKNKFQNKIGENNYNIQYPYIDRLEKEILNNSIEKTLNYKYKRKGTQIFGVGLEQIFSNIQNIIYISILYGSITQILCLRNTVAKVLLLYADSLNDEELYKIALKFYALSGEYKEFKNVSDKLSLNFRSLESREYLKEILKLRSAILIYNIEFYDIFIFDYYGRILNESEYIIYENKMLTLLESNNSTLVNSIFKSIPNNIARFKKFNTFLHIVEKKMDSFVYRREFQSILNYIVYEELSNNNRKIIKRIINKMIENGDYLIITDLLIDIKKIDNVSTYDKILLKDGSDGNLLFRIKTINDDTPECLELIIDEMTRRNMKTIETKTIVGYSTTYNVVSDFFDNDSSKLRKIIESKIFPLAELSISSQYIEVIEKLKLLRSLLYIYFFDNKYDYKIKEILNVINLKSGESRFKLSYCSDYLSLYIDLFKYLFGEITFDELLNIYVLSIIENENVFSEIRLILEYLHSKIKFEEENFNKIYIMINIALNSKEEANRENAIILSKILYNNSKYFTNVYQKLIAISKDSKYNEMKAVIILIKKLKDNKNELIEQLIYNINHNKNYNIRYMGKKNLIK